MINGEDIEEWMLIVGQSRSTTACSTKDDDDSELGKILNLQFNDTNYIKRK